MGDLEGLTSQLTSLFFGRANKLGVPCLDAACTVGLRPRSHYSVFVQKRRENLRFCESVHTDPHKNATKTEVFENAIKSGYPQKRRFLKTHLINVNAQKRRFLKTLQYATMGFTKTEQCERTKTEFFAAFLLSGRSV